MKGQLTIQYLASFIFFIGLIIYVYFSYSANIPRFVEEVEKEDVRSKAYQLSEILINDPGESIDWMEPSEIPVDVVLIIDMSSSMMGVAAQWGKNCRYECTSGCDPNCDVFGGSKDCCVAVGFDVSYGDPTPHDCPTCSDCDGDGNWADPGETPCALNDAKEASKTFVALLNPTTGRAGLVVFNQTAYGRPEYQGLTDIFQDVNDSVDTIRSKRGADTQIGLGIENATKELQNNGRDQNELNVNWVEILLTDGKDFPNPTDARGAAQDAADENITIYTIGLGEPGVHFDENLLKDIATITDGKYYNAPSSADLEDIYRQIAIEIKLKVERVGLSDENFNKTNLITMCKIRYLDDLCTSFKTIQQKLGIDKPFSIYIFNISQTTGEREVPLLECVSPDFPKTTINTTIKRITALNNTETGRLELAELIVQM